MWTAVELLREFRTGRLSPVEVTAAVNARVRAIDPTVRALAAWTPELADEQAREAQHRYRTGTARPLEGVPYVAKDLFDTAGVLTGYGSGLFEGHIPDRDADVVARMRAAGAVLVGKATTHEFGWGYTTVSERRGPSRNPWSPARVAGGSSGGSAAALAAGMTPLALGSDTGGSVRVPAAFCGVVGFKPSYGSVPRSGLFPLAPSLDHVGSMARTPADAALLLATLATEPPRPDMTTWIAALERAQQGERMIRRPLHVGVLADPAWPSPAPAVTDVVAGAATRLAALGATVADVELAGVDDAADTFAVIQLTEALTVHRQRGLFPARRAEYGTDVQARLRLAEQVDPAEVTRAGSRRERMRDHLRGMFTEVDLLLGPVSAGPPPLIGEDLVAHRGERVELRRLLLPWVAPQSLAGLPACVLRGGIDSNGLPIGVQLTGPVGADARVLEVAALLFGADPELQQRWPIDDAALAPTGGSR